MENQSERFFSSILKRMNSLCFSTDILPPLLNQFLAQSLITKFDRDLIETIPVNYNKAEKLFNILGKQLEKLDMILDILTDNNQTQAAKILKEVRSSLTQTPLNASKAVRQTPIYGPKILNADAIQIILRELEMDGSIELVSEPTNEPVPVLELNAMNLNATYLANNGCVDEALLISKKLFPLLLQHYGLPHKHTLFNILRIASILRAKRKLDAALYIYKVIVGVEEEPQGSATDTKIAAKMDIAIIYYAEKKFKDAIALQLDVIEFNVDAYGPSSKTTLQSERELAKYLTNDGQVAESIKILERITNAFERYGDEELSETKFELAYAYCEAWKYFRAGEEYREVLRLRKDLFPSNHLKIILTKFYLATTLGKLKQYEEARALYEETIEAAKTVPDVVGIDFVPELENELVSLISTEALSKKE